MLGALLCASPAASEEGPLFDLPIDCSVGETCVIQNYVDRDPGPGARDFQCGHLSYNGHKGTDFRLRDLRQMRRGVVVRSAAPGRVIGVRDGMPDVNIREIGVAALKGRDCGNGVRISHGGGWVTQYCHMRKGSVMVARGDRVDTGQAIGLVGLSGRTEFPHLHFEISHEGTPIDPFVGPSHRSGCRVGETPLWRDASAQRLSYRSVGLIDAGFADKRPEMRELDERRHGKARLGSGSGALVFWVRVFGLRPGDRQRLVVRRPDGTVLVDSAPKSVDRPKADWMAFSGKRRPKSGAWPTGTYHGTYTLTRGGREVVSVTRSIEVR